MSERRPDQMTEEERFTEIASLLAVGAVRVVRRSASIDDRDNRSSDRDSDESRVTKG